MSKLVAILTIFLLPLMAFAKVGESKASFERSYTKGSYQELPQLLKLIPDGAGYIDKKTGYWLLGWFQLGEFAGAAKSVRSDDELTKFIQLVLGTTDVEARTDVNPLLKWVGMQAFSTKDGKLGFNTYSGDIENPYRAVVAGTRAFLESFESGMLFAMAKHMSATPTPTPSPEPTPTPTPTDVTSQFTNAVVEALEPVYDAVSNAKDAASFNALAAAFRKATTRLKALKPLWDQLPSAPRPVVSAAMGTTAEYLENIKRTLSAIPGVDRTTIQASSELTEAVKSFQP